MSQQHVKEDGDPCLLIRLIEVETVAADTRSTTVRGANRTVLGTRFGVDDGIRPD